MLTDLWVYFWACRLGYRPVVVYATLGKNAAACLEAATLGSFRVLDVTGALSIP